jgi:hypothetical protein
MSENMQPENFKRIVPEGDDHERLVCKDCGWVTAAQSMPKQLLSTKILQRSAACAEEAAPISVANTADMIGFLGNDIFFTLLSYDAAKRCSWFRLIFGTILPMRYMCLISIVKM